MTAPKAVAAAVTVASKFVGASGICSPVPAMQMIVCGRHAQRKLVGR
jgi:hypothetical protein